MKELLYKKSEAVAALNRVDGFNPICLSPTYQEIVGNVGDVTPDYHFHREYGSCGSTYLSG